MSEQKVMNRWLVVVGAVLIQLCLGAIYAWSVFTPPLKATNEKDIATTYSQKLLNIDESQYVAMTNALAPSAKELASTGIAIKLAKSKDEKSELETKQSDITGKMNEITSQYVSAETITSLRYGFTNTQTQAIFAAGLAFFAIVMVLAGRMMPKTGPRKLAIAGGIVLGLGYILAGLFGEKSFMTHLLCIGVVGGSGIGLGYVVPIAVGMRWFPDKKGLITGLAVAGFGFGATLWIKLAGTWGSLIASNGLPNTFIVYGIAFAAMVILGGLTMVFPPDGWKPEGWTPAPVANGTASVDELAVKSGEMLRTPQFYMILFTFMFGASAGLMSIGLMKAFPITALAANGISPAEASAIAGFAMAIFFSLANGIGRIAWGAICGKLGVKKSIVIMMLMQGIVVIAFQKMAGYNYTLYLGATLIGFNFGGNFALFPMITANTFGAKTVGQNYGWVFLAYGIGGVFGPMLGGKLGDMNNFPLAFTICGVLCLVAAGIITMVKPPKHAET